MASQEPKPSDAELVRAVRSGDREAYGRLADRYLGSVYAAAIRITCNAAAAEDVAQDTILRALQRLDLYDMKHPFRNWLLKIATNLALNQLRSRRRERLLHERVAADELRNGHAAEADDAIPSRSHWQQWLSQLDESQRAAIVLFHFHELPYAEIAQVLNLPLNTVRTLLHRGRRRLRDVMGSHPMLENGSWNVAI